LAAAVFAPVILFAITFFPVSDYVEAMAGARGFYGGWRHSMYFFTTLLSLSLYHTL
jgi:hypothetical protein